MHLKYILYSDYYLRELINILDIYFLYLYKILIYLPFILLIIFCIKVVFNIKNKSKHSNHMAKGLDAIIDKYINKENYEQDIAINLLYPEVEYFYNQYVESNIGAKKLFPNIAVWIDYISMIINLQTNHNQIRFKNLFLKLGINKYFDYLYDKMPYITAIQNYIHNLHPFYKATPYQQYLLKDICQLEDNNSHENISSIVQKIESEFLRLENDIKQNQKNNKISITIGVLGIVVSILLAIINFT